MSNKSKGGGPKTDKGKAISSGNSITHGLTAKRWINIEEQELFDATLERIMLRGGWKSETTALRYLRNWNDQNWSLINHHLNV